MAPAALLLPIPVDLAVGGSFLAAGAVAWRRRPENRTGLLMVLSGIAWFCRDFARWDAAVPRHLGELSLNVFLALIAHQVVVFPYGVARTRVERGLVGAVYALAFGGYVLSEVFPSTNEPLAALAIPLILATIFTVVQRWLAATPPERRALEPILWAGPLALVVATASIAHDYLDVGSSSGLAQARVHRDPDCVPRRRLAYSASARSGWRPRRRARRCGVGYRRARCAGQDPW